uniref:Uncharacterized protein n=1 Tax=Anguilla anguilla TaxID=7936 RepID=A0A0E9XXI8_ANGAN
MLCKSLWIRMSAKFLYVIIIVLIIIMYCMSC